MDDPVAVFLWTGSGNSDAEWPESNCATVPQEQGNCRYS
jgi:hypothetical protein